MTSKFLVANKPHFASVNSPALHALTPRVYAPFGSVRSVVLELLPERDPLKTVAPLAASQRRKSYPVALPTALQAKVTPATPRTCPVPGDVMAGAASPVPVSGRTLRMTFSSTLPHEFVVSKT